MGTRKDKFSFVIEASGDSWDIGDLDNITKTDALKIAYIVEKERGINEVSCDEYIGENIYIEGDWETNEIKANVETLLSEMFTIDVFTGNRFYTNDSIEEEDLVAIVNQYLSENEKEDYVSTDCEDVIANKIYDYNDARYNIMLNVDLSIKYWDANIYITYNETVVEPYESFTLNVDI